MLAEPELVRLREGLQLAPQPTADDQQRIPAGADARTGRPPEGVASVAVVAGSLAWADIDATAAYAQGVEAARWLEARPGRSGLVVWADGTTTTV